MTWQPPAGYVRRTPDVEALVLDMVQPLLDAGTPVGRAVTWWPDDSETLIAQGVPLARVRKIPGIVELDGRKIQANVLLTVRTGTRSESWDILTYLGDELTRRWNKGGIVDREDGSRSAVARLEVDAADQQLPELDPDFRAVSNYVSLTLMRRTA
ncbi:phage tail termination protein [Tsukamurella ocularis]|uniref:phage tail termination protein n=1 Tax=Tsukamurella ocularis TaxID=1970234 RepID=UPI0039EE1EEA